MAADCQDHKEHVVAEDQPTYNLYLCVYIYITLRAISLLVGTQSLFQEIAQVGFRISGNL